MIGDMNTSQRASINRPLNLTKFMSNQHHVTYNGDEDHWEIRRSGAKRPSHTFDKKQEAVDKARIISDNQDTELIIHNKNGQIADKDSHGNDPKSVPG